MTQAETNRTARGSRTKPERRCRVSSPAEGAQAHAVLMVRPRQRPSVRMPRLKSGRVERDTHASLGA